MPYCVSLKSFEIYKKKPVVDVDFCDVPIVSVLVNDTTDLDLGKPHPVIINCVCYVQFFN